MSSQVSLKKLLIDFSENHSNNAFEIFYNELYQLAFHTAFYITNNTADTEDAVQQSFISVYKGIDSCKALQEDSDQKIKSWFLGIVYNQAKMTLRKKIRIRSKESHASKNRSNQNPEIDTMVNESKDQMQNKLQNAIETLPEKYRTPILLKYKDGLEYNLIGNILSLNQSTLRNRISRGINFLKDKLRANENEINKILPSLAIIPIFGLPQKVSIPKFNPQATLRLNATYKASTSFSIKAIAATFAIAITSIVAFNLAKANKNLKEIRTSVEITTTKDLINSKNKTIDLSDGSLDDIVVVQGLFEFKNNKRNTQILEEAKNQDVNSTRTFINFKKYNFKIPCKLSVIGGPIFKNKNMKLWYVIQGCYSADYFANVGKDVYLSIRDKRWNSSSSSKYADGSIYTEDKSEIYFLNDYIVTKYQDKISKITKYDANEHISNEIGLILTSYAIDKIIYNSLTESEYSELKKNADKLINSPKNELKNK